MAITFEDSLSGGGGSSGDPVDGEVANFSALPSAAASSGLTYRVLAEQGTWFLGTLKRAGDYYSDGVSWTHLGSSSYIVKAYDTSTTDNALVKYHSTDGQSIQESGIIVDDSDNVSGVASLNVDEVAAPGTPSTGTVVMYAKTDGKMYIKDDTGAETDLTAAGGAGGFPTGTSLDGTDYYSGSPLAGYNSFSTVAMASGTVEYTPLIVGETTTYTRIGINVTTAGAASSIIRLGIHQTVGSGDLAPGALVLDAGTVAADSTGEKEITISQELTPGLYWLAACSDGAPVVTRYSGLNTYTWGFMLGSSSATSTTLLTNLVKTSTTEYSALSDPAPTTLSLDSSASRVWVRAV